MAVEWTINRVLKLLRAEVENRGSQLAVAKAWGVSSTHINDVLKGRREIGPTLLGAMGLERVVTYRERPKRKSVQEAGYVPVDAVEDERK